MKQSVFTLIALGIPILFFGLLETGLRLGQYRGNTDLFVYPDGLDDHVVANRNFASRYFFSTTVIPTPITDFFLREKPENGFRVFVLGESSTAGYPYPNNGAFSRVTRDMLQDALPDDHVEVINVATSAINTYTLYDQADEILAFKPDAVLIYTGHNEYYGALGIGSSESLGGFPGFVRFYLDIQRLKTFMLLRDGMTRLSKWVGSWFRSGPQQNETLMQQVVREQVIALDSPVYDLGLRQFEQNMRAILDIFTDAGVPVFVGSVASNLRDFEPFESVAVPGHPPAAAVFASAGERYRSGDIDSAATLFTYARDLDALRFRAPSAINEIIRRLADEGLARYVPSEEALARIAEDGIIGYDLMLEHLHPNSVGYHRIGVTYFEAMREAGFLGRQADPSGVKSDAHYYQAMEQTELDHRIVAHRVMILTRNWPFVKEGPPFRYVNYRYESVPDSFAFRVVNNLMRWDEAKVELGEFYRRNGKTDLALAEFRSLMRDQSFSDSPFVFGARVLLDAGRLSEAEPYLRKAHAIAATGYTYKMLGAIEVDRRNFADGIRLLEASLKEAPNDPQTLFNLSGALAQSGDLPRALELARRIQRSTPNFPGIQTWVAQLERLTR